MAALRLAVFSDIHYACKAEQDRGDDYELRAVANPALRLLLRLYRHHVWLRTPLRNNYLLEDAIRHVSEPDLLITNGDYSCDSAFVGLSDAAARESTRACLARLRERYPGRFHATPGDHEFGKTSFFGDRGGLRLESWARLPDVGLEPLWRKDAGGRVIVGVASSILGLPVFERDTLPEERKGWAEIRTRYLAEVNELFSGIPACARILLFCHDPTALPWLGRVAAVRDRLQQIEQTVIGHLHSGLILRQSRILSGMPRITFLGPSVQRMTAALREARGWKQFHVRLCPSLAGIELLKDGGYLTCELTPGQELQWKQHRLARRPANR